MQTVHFTIVSANQFNLAAIVHEVSLRWSPSLVYVMIFVRTMDDYNHRVKLHIFMISINLAHGSLSDVGLFYLWCFFSFRGVLSIRL